MKSIIAITALTLVAGCASWQPEYPVSVDTSRDIVEKKAEEANRRVEGRLVSGEAQSTIYLTVSPNGRIVESRVKGDQVLPIDVIQFMRPMPAHKGEGNVRYTIEIDANAPR